MIKLPDKLTGSAVMFLDGHNGGYEQLFRNEEFGINISKGRKNRNEPTVLIITMDAIPDKSFSSFAELQAYVKNLENEDLLKNT